MVVSHAQVTAKLGELSIQWPTIPRTILEGEAAVTEFTFTEFSTVDCVTRQLGFSLLDMFTASSPSFGGVSGMSSAPLDSPAIMFWSHSRCQEFPVGPLSHPSSYERPATFYAPLDRST